MMQGSIISIKRGDHKGIRLIWTGPRWFTLPPNSIPWPWILVNAHRPRQGLSYIKKHNDVVELVLIDSGVEMFKVKPWLKNYPDGWIHHLAGLYFQVRNLVGGKVLVNAPDVPTDYPNNPIEDNIEKTIDNVVEALREYKNVRWIIPIQGKYMQPKSFIKTILVYDALGITKLYRYFSIGNLCTTRKTSIIIESINIVRSLLPTKYLHYFGLYLRALPYVKSRIDSFDSVRYTFPTSEIKRMGKNWSCKNRKEREEYFLSYLRRVIEVLICSNFCR